MSGAHNRKNSYQGLNVRRLPRSEFDDNTMRDLNRYDNRLDHNLRNVEKQKEVMLRSLEKDKSIFMKGGTRSNKKYTVSIQNPGDSRQRRDSSTSQPSKYQSDTRNKKPQGQSSQATTQQPKTGTGNDEDGTSGGGGQTRRKQSKEDNNSTSYSSSSSGGVGGGGGWVQSRDILTETREVIDKHKKGDDLVDEFMSNHAGVEGRLPGDKQKGYHLSTTGHHDTGNHVDPGALESRNSQHLSHGYDSSGYNSATPSIRVEDYHPAMTDMADHGQVNGKFVPTSFSQQFPFYDDLTSYGRRPDFWERMSTPKNPSRNLQKREQLEREFSSAALKSRAATPAAPKSAKGTRTLISSTSGPSGTTSLMTSTSGTTPSSITAPTGKSGPRKKSSPVPGQKMKPKVTTSYKGK